MKIRIIQEEITSYVDGEKSYIGKCTMLKMEIKENSEHIQLIFSQMKNEVDQILQQEIEEEKEVVNEL